MSTPPALAPTNLTRPLALVGMVLALAGVGLVSTFALVSVLIDGLAAAMVLLPAALAGIAIVPWLGLGEMPKRWHYLIGAGLGIGLTALLVLLLGLAGLLDRRLWIGIIMIFAVAGVLGLRRVSHPTGTPPPRTDSAGRFMFLWLLVVVPVVLAAVAAAHAPGLLWREEGFGYDVLEYHLQLPKEYHQAGQIAYVPHNVYANFPANVEMLYLLAMVVLEDEVGTGITANMIHLGLAMLTVFAAWVAGRTWSPRAGVVAAVTMATAGWLSYLSGLAYVENGMLFFGMTAAAMACRSCAALDASEGNGDTSSAANTRIRWMLVAGAMAGLSCGCKYTAVPMIAVPLAVMVWLAPRASGSIRVRHTAAFALGCAITFSPWLVKNQLMTGNPVFPLANSVFHAAPPGWDHEATLRWDRGHSPQADQQGLIAKGRLLWAHVLWDKYHRLGPTVFVLGLGGLWARRRDRIDHLLVLMVVVQLGVWLLATHLYARFAVVLLIPLALLAGRSMMNARSAHRDRWIVVLLLLGSGWNTAYAAALQRRESVGGAPPSLIAGGQLPGFEYYGVVNRELPPDAKILLIGDARAFYFERPVDYFVVFNRNPFIDALRRAEDDRDIIDWLTERQYLYVLVNWSEVTRLRETYGFAEEITPQRFEQLTASGLALVRRFEHPTADKPYVSLYRVPGIGD